MCVIIHLGKSVVKHWVRNGERQRETERERERDRERATGVNKPIILNKILCVVWLQVCGNEANGGKMGEVC